MPESQDNDTHATMNPNYILDLPVPANPGGSEVLSTFTPPIFIEMGEEGGEYLEAIVKEQVRRLLWISLIFANSHLRLARSLKPTKTGPISLAVALLTHPSSVVSCFSQMLEVDVGLR